MDKVVCEDHDLLDPTLMMAVFIADSELLSNAKNVLQDFNCMWLYSLHRLAKHSLAYIPPTFYHKKYFSLENILLLMRLNCFSLLDLWGGLKRDT